MITKRLNELKTQGNYSWQDLSDMTGIPVPTIRKTFSGETANPSFDVVSKLMTAMNGSMDDPNKLTQGEDNMNDVMELFKSMYDARIADLWNVINKISAEKRTLFFSMLTIISVLLIFVIYLFIDGMHGNWGFFRY